MPVTDPASLLPAVSCDFCHVTTGPCVYLTGPNKGKPRAARYGYHAQRVIAAQRAAAWYDKGFTAGAASRQSEVDLANRSLQATEVALDKARSDLADYKVGHPDPVVTVTDNHDGTLTLGGSGVTTHKGTLTLTTSGASK
jgi:hypothetical protein